MRIDFPLPTLLESNSNVDAQKSNEVRKYFRELLKVRILEFTYGALQALQGDHLAAVVQLQRDRIKKFQKWLKVLSRWPVLYDPYLEHIMKATYVGALEAALWVLKEDPRVLYEEAKTIAVGFAEVFDLYDFIVQEENVH